MGIIDGVHSLPQTEAMRALFFDRFLVGGLCGPEGALLGITLDADRRAVRPPRQLCGPDKPSRTWSAFEERTMTEVREGSWAIAQLLAPVHRYEGASRRSLRTSRKSCAHSVSSVKLSEKTGEARQPGTSESSAGWSNDSEII